MKQKIWLCIWLIWMISFSFTITVIANENQASDEMYYILVDRFTNGTSVNDRQVNLDDPNAFHGGDLAGVNQQLSHVQQLGMETINISPVMETDVYHGFAVTDFRSVSSHFGSLEDLQQLVASAHDKNMKVILDFPLTQMSEDHSWVENRPEWVIRADENPESQMPRPDFQESEVVDYFVETISFWLDEANVDGFHFYADAQIPDHVMNTFVDTVHQKGDHTAIVDGRATNEGMQMNQSLQQQMTSVFKQAGTSLEPLFASENSSKQEDVLFLESLTTNRFAYEAVQAEHNPVTRVKLALTYMYTVPGQPMLYQGLEVPMDNGKPTPDHRMARINQTEEEVVQRIEKLSELRSQYPALVDGELEYIEQEGAMSVYKRQLNDQEIYIAINNDEVTQMAELESISGAKQLRGVLYDDIVREQEDGTHQMILERETANIFIVEEDTGLNWPFLSFLIVVFGGFITFVIVMTKKNT
ncbi:alpha-amylase family protein [Gracilibacillus halophilus YIM-C55.5]|uniref:Alpha-amylase family protein n=1 Tax=Gracilibacillus halophilus YIM-C55.5 TaxID=1308866 RepID=N4W7D1_9BACI|nr:alpha-amylase family glycosyl hydrolase [Gracilibacillus halophilus]ENH96158.1 alpha-amylase family protein [Gracilibacillus halophilus YIM-C55.5]